MSDYREFLKVNPEAITQLSCNVFWGRSGSYLFCSLLDGHPEVISLPPNGYEPAVEKIFDLVPTLKNSSVDSIVATLYQLFPMVTIEGNFKDQSSIVNSKASFVGSADHKNDLLEVGVPEKKFLSSLQEIIEIILQRNLTITARLLINSVHIAYAIAGDILPKRKDPVIFLSLHVHNCNVLNKLHSEYENFSLVINVRHPAKAYDSHLYHHYYESTVPPLASLSARFCHLMLNNGQCYTNPSGIKINTIAVRFEDMHFNTRGTMLKICDFLNIKWDDCLLESTICGKKIGLKKNGVVYSGIGHEFAKDMRLRVLGPIDVFFVQKVLSQYYSQWSYKKHIFSPLQKVVYSCILRYFPYLTCIRGFILEFKRLRKEEKREKIKERIKLCHKDACKHVELIKLMLKGKQLDIPDSVIKQERAS